MKRSRVNPVSKKRRNAIPQRQALRLDQLAKAPQCEAALDICTTRATDVHEIVNRSQRSTAWLEPDLFLSLCRPCHRWVTDHPMWSRHHGLSLASYRGTPQWVNAAASVRATCRSRVCLFDHMIEHDND